MATTRGRRYADARSLRVAVRAWAAAEYERRSGVRWTDADAARLRDDTAESPARDTWLAIESALVVARAWLRAHPHENDGYALRVRAAVAAFPHVTQAEPRTAWTLRGAIVAEYGRAGHWWWRDRQPKPRDLTILTILAGSWPDIETAYVTVLDVIRAEDRAARQAMTRGR